MKGLTELLEASDDRADLTPLIDCVFLLLLFFVVTAVFVEESNLFKVNLPKSRHAELREMKDVVVVMISRSGQFSVGRSLIAESQLWETLSAMNGETPIRTLVVKADRQCPYEKVHLVREMAQSLGVREFAEAMDTGRAD